MNGIIARPVSFYTKTRLIVEYLFVTRIVKKKNVVRSDKKIKSNKNRIKTLYCISIKSVRSICIPAAGFDIYFINPRGLAIKILLAGISGPKVQ